MTHEEELMTGWRRFDPGDQIGDAPGKTEWVHFRNQTDSKGKYTLKIGDAPAQHHELKAGQRSDKYAVNKKPWNGSNDGSVQLGYERKNVPNI
jgi:hypothetical protein